MSTKTFILSYIYNYCHILSYIIIYYHILSYIIYYHILSIVFYSSLSMLAGFLVPRWFAFHRWALGGPSSSRDGCGPCCWLGRSAFGGSHGWNNLGHIYEYIYDNIIWIYMLYKHIIYIGIISMFGGVSVCHSHKVGSDITWHGDSYNGYHWGHFVGSAIKGGLHAICNWLYIKKSDIVGWCLSTKWGIVINPFIGIYLPIKQMPSVE